MKESNELFELCKQVYEATGWDSEYKYFYGTSSVAHDRQHSMLENTPLYTSDYLLEKLPNQLDKKWLNLSPETSYKGLWVADYQDNKEVASYIEFADTPLKALLKLTLELHKEGLL